MSIKIRRAGLDDALSIAKVHVAAWRAAYEGLFDGAAIARRSVEIREDQWRRGLAWPEERGLLVWVAEDEGQIVGFISAGPGEDATAPSAVGEVYTLYLEPSRIGQGVGRALMLESLDELKRRGFTEAILWVLADNTRARRFYEAAGLSWDGTERIKDRNGWKHRDVRYRRSL